VTVRKRDLTVSGLSATDRVYDGTAVVTITGTPTLIALPGWEPGTASGPGTRVSVAGGTGTGTLVDASAGERTFRHASPACRSPVRTHRTTPSRQPTGLTVDITPRPLTITADDAVKVGGRDGTDLHA
jgi:hypothetical protein